MGLLEDCKSLAKLLVPNVSSHVCSLKGALIRNLHILWKELGSGVLKTL